MGRDSLYWLASSSALVPDGAQRISTCVPSTGVREPNSEKNFATAQFAGSSSFSDFLWWLPPPCGRRPVWNAAVICLEPFDLHSARVRAFSSTVTTNVFEPWRDCLPGSLAALG
ncbi:hypothetical protein WJX84_011690 [Apatococcus fuscideae]|uniref:Secreted protein n=1 Tax=Apatococcus fuscideae TaxID=2026836 RepID=A0AAW1SUD1_9CHLO